MSINGELYIARARIEEAENWREVALHKMPFIKFPSDWEIAVIPPFGGAIARFRVKLPNGKIKSVYADLYGNIKGSFRPCWEVYPYRYDDYGQCDFEDIDSLLRMIAWSDKDE